MVDLEERKFVVQVLQNFLDRKTTNKDLERDFAGLAADKPQRDRGINAVYGFFWNLYDDFEEHKLEGEWEPDGAVREMAQRCVAFLKTGFEYEWRQASFIGIDWRRVFSRFLPWIKWEEDPLKRFEKFLAEQGGDVSVWPFYRREDYETSLRD